MDLFVVGTLVSATLFMVSSMVDEAGGWTRAQRVSMTPVPADKVRQSHQLEEEMPYDQAA
jgi:hypothetical protein